MKSFTMFTCLHLLEFIIFLRLILTYLVLSQNLYSSIRNISYHGSNVGDGILGNVVVYVGEG